MSEYKVKGIEVRIDHDGHEHKVTFVKNDVGKYEVWIDGKLIRLSGIFSIINAKRILKKHLK